MSDNKNAAQLDEQTVLMPSVSIEPKCIAINKSEIEDTKIFEHKSLSQRIPGFGILLALIAGIFLSFQAVVVNLIDLHPIETLVFRCAFMLIVFGMVIIRYKHQLFGKPEFRKDLILRSVLGTIAISCTFTAYKMIPISDVATIQTTSPVFVTIVDYFMLKESITIVQILVCFFTAIGIGFLIKPEFIFGSESEVIHERRIEGIVLVFIGVFCNAFSTISMRKLNTTPVAVIVFWFSITVTISSLAYLLITNNLILPNGIETWIYLLCSGVCGTGGHYFYTKAFHYEKAGPLAVTKSLRIVNTFILGVVFLSQTIEWNSILGAIIILLSILWLTISKWKRETS